MRHLSSKTFIRPSKLGNQLASVIELLILDVSNPIADQTADQTGHQSTWRPNGSVDPDFSFFSFKVSSKF